MAAAEGSEARPVSDPAVRASRWLVVGANGMLGHDLVDVIAAAGHEVVGMDLPEIDITVAATPWQPPSTRSAPTWSSTPPPTPPSTPPRSTRTLALRVNGEGPRVLAAADRAASRHPAGAHHHGLRVRRRRQRAPTPRTPPPAPRSAYGRTKLAGELAVRERPAGPRHSSCARRGSTASTAPTSSGPCSPSRRPSPRSPSSTTSAASRPGAATSRARSSRCSTPTPLPGIYHGTSSGRDDVVRVHARDLPAHRRRPASGSSRRRPTRSRARRRDRRTACWATIAGPRSASPPIRDWHEALAEALPLMRATGDHVGRSAASRGRIRTGRWPVSRSNSRSASSVVSVAIRSSRRLNFR